MTVKTTLNKKYSKLRLDSFHLTLVGGGLVDRNQVLMQGDKVIAVPTGPSPSTVQRKLKEKRGYGRSRLKDKLYGHKSKQQKMITTELGAFDPLTSVYDAH